MSRKLMLKNTGIYTIVLLLPQLTSFLLLPLYTRYLTPADYAVLTLVSSFTAIIGIFVALQLQNGIARYVIGFMTKGERRQAQVFLTSVTAAMLAVMAVSFLFFELFGGVLVRVTYPKSNIPYHPFFMLSLLTVMFSAVSQVPQALFKSLQMAKSFSIMSICVLITTITFNVLFLVVMRMGVYGIFLGGLIGSIVGCILSLWVIRDWFYPAFSWVYVRQAVQFSLPLIPHSLGTFLFTTSNRIVLEKYLPLSEIGLFSIADRISGAALMLVGAFNIAYNPYFISQAENSEKKAVEWNADIMGFWWIALLVVIIGFTAYADLILRVMATRAYYAAAGISSILVFSSLFRGLYCFASSPLFYGKKTYYIPAITLTAGIASILLNVLFVPIWGLAGAAWVTVISYIITFLLADYFGRKVMPIMYPWKTMLVTGALGGAIVLAARMLPRSIAMNDVVYVSFIGIMLIAFGIIGVYVHEPRALRRIQMRLGMIRADAGTADCVASEEEIFENAKEKSG